MMIKWIVLILILAMITFMVLLKPIKKVVGSLFELIISTIILVLMLPLLTVIIIPLITIFTIVSIAAFIAALLK